ncbi:MAG: SulP family sulfate permease [Gammaproteobacteria bacterium]
MTKQSISDIGHFSVADIVAGISVGLVLVPQSMAYAGLAGLSPVHGLYAAAIAPIAAAFFASSPFLQSGPVAMTSVLSFGALSAIAIPMTAEYMLLAALLALVVGVVRVVFGLLRAGFVSDLLSQPITMGFTRAAGLLIIGSQLPKFLGAEAPVTGIVGSTLWTVSHPLHWSLESCAIGAATVCVIVIGRRIHTLFPGVLVAVAGGIAYSIWSSYEGAVIGDVPAAFPSISLALPWEYLPHLIFPGVVIALVGFAEPAAIARTMATQTRTRWSPDRELISQGVANFSVGLVGGFPVGGSFSRTMVNRGAGATSRWSGLITGLFVLSVLPFASHFAPLPLTVLAAIVIHAVIKLLDFSRLIRLLSISPPQAIVGWTTFGLTLALAPRIDLAVMIGIGLGIGVHLWRERNVHINTNYRDGELTLEPVGVIYFGSVTAFDDALIDELAQHPNATRLIIDLRKVGRLDFTGVQTIRGVAADAQSAGLGVRIIPGHAVQGAKVLRRVISEDLQRFHAEETVTIEIDPDPSAKIN